MGRDPLHTWPVDMAGVSQAVLQAPEANLNNPCTRFHCTTSRMGCLPSMESCPATHHAAELLMQALGCSSRAKPLEEPWSPLKKASGLPQCHPQNKATSTGALFIPVGRVGALSSESPPGCCSPELSGGSFGSHWLKGQPPVSALHPYFSQAFPPRYPGLGTWQQLAQGSRAASDKVKTVPGT